MPLRTQVDITMAMILSYDGKLEAAKKLLSRRVDGREVGPIIAVATILGLWTEDEPYLRRVLALAESSPPLGLTASHAAEARAAIAMVRGQHALASELLDQTLALVFPLSPNLPAMILTRSELRLALGDIPGAEADVADVERRLAGIELPYAAGMLDVMKAHLARRRGATSEAEACAHRALVIAMPPEMPLIATWALEALVLLHADADRGADAARLLGAVDAFRQRSSFKWRAHHSRDELDALRLRLDPVALGEGASMPLWDAVAYARRGRGERGRPDHGWESVTPTELRVVELVAAGLPNKEVAQRLFVSVATVKTHLVHVFGKLDVRTRAELATAATRRRLASPSEEREG